MEMGAFHAGTKIGSQIEHGIKVEDPRIDFTSAYLPRTMPTRRERERERGIVSTAVRARRNPSCLFIIPAIRLYTIHVHSPPAPAAPKGLAAPAFEVQWAVANQGTPRGHAVFAVQSYVCCCCFPPVFNVKKKIGTKRARGKTGCLCEKL